MEGPLGFELSFRGLVGIVGDKLISSFTGARHTGASSGRCTHPPRVRAGDSKSPGQAQRSPRANSRVARRVFKFVQQSSAAKGSGKDSGEPERKLESARDGGFSSGAYDWRDRHYLNSQTCGSGGIGTG